MFLFLDNKRVIIVSIQETQIKGGYYMRNKIRILRVKCKIVKEILGMKLTTKELNYLAGFVSAMKE